MLYGSTTPDPLVPLFCPDDVGLLTLRLSIILLDFVDILTSSRERTEAKLRPLELRLDLASKGLVSMIRSSFFALSNKLRLVLESGEL